MDESRGASVASPVAAKLAQYTPVRLTADLEGLSEGERRMIPLLIAATQEMDTIFWQQAYSSRDSLLSTISDSATRQFLLLNYGPWDRLDANQAPILLAVLGLADNAADAVARTQAETANLRRGNVDVVR